MASARATVSLPIVLRACQGYLGSMSEVTQILHAIEQGDAHAPAQLLPLIYDQLRKLAAHQLSREKAGQTLDPTALVHEAYLRLVGTDDNSNWQNRGHFFAAAAEAMRRILIENARRKQSHKRGGGRVRQSLDESLVAASAPHEDILALDEALQKLAVKDPVKAQLVKLRYFAGLTGNEAARALGISSTTAERYWAYARAWLYKQIRSDEVGRQDTAAEDSRP